MTLDATPPELSGLQFDGGDNSGAREFTIQHYADAGNTVTTMLADADVLSLEGMGGAAGQTGVSVDLDNQDTGDPADGYLSFGTTTISLLNFEHVLGTDSDDAFLGSDVRNVFFGFTGDDILVGRGGEDALIGDDGADVLYGGYWVDDATETPDPLNYVDDGATDILYGGLGNDTYYVSNQDLIYDMTVEQSAVPIPDGQGGLTLASDGEGTVVFNGIQLGDAEWIELGEDPLDGYPRRHEWYDYSGAGATHAVFKDFDTGFLYRVLQVSTMIDGQQVLTWRLAVEDWNTQTHFEIGNVAYDPDTHTLGFPTGGSEPVVTSSLTTSTTDTAVEPVAVDLSDGDQGLIRAVAGDGDASAFDDALSAALAGLASGESDSSAPEPAGGAEGTGPASNEWRGHQNAGAPAASGTLESETVETSTLATIEASSTAGSYLGITFYEPDPIDGTAGDDNVTLTNGDDTYDAGAGNDTVKGRNGNDTLIGGLGDDLLDGGNNDDILEGGAGSDTLKGGNGIDTADYRTSNDGVYASLSNGSGNAFNNVGNIKWLDSLDGIENLAGSSLADRLYGDSGNNVLTGRAGDDWLSGGRGNDVFAGGLGNDRMTGDDGDDLFTGGAGHDQMTGYGGSDVFDGGEGQDTVLLSWITSGDAAVIDMAAGTYEGAAAGNTYISIENFYGTSIAAAGDTILGDDNKNYFFGRAGDDTLDGRGGDDVLVGGTGADTLTGGAGVDWFFYANTSESGTTAGTRDLITDFTRGEDYFDLSMIDAQTGVSSNQQPDRHRRLVRPDRYEHVGGNTIVEGDVNGDAVADFSIELSGLHDLTLADFTSDSVSWLWAGTAGDDTIQAGPLDDVIAGGFGNDVLLGGAGNDGINGNDGDDQLFGEDGDDVLSGDAGADLLDGGAGTDEAFYVSAPEGVVADLADPTANTGEAAGDTYMSIENLRGSQFDDALRGDAGANVIWGGDGDDNLYGAAGDDSLYGEGGNDSLDGGSGADLLDGGDGTDWASYVSALGGVSVNLATGEVSGAEAGDTLVSIENLLGSDFDDTLIGDAGSNEIIGNAGADTLSGGGGDDLLEGGAGADHHDGGSGTDEVRYLSALAGVVASLADAAISAGDAAGDTYASVENLRGSLFDDELHGDAGDNTIWGESGDDSLHGGAGADALHGDVGNDSLHGAAGSDSLYGGDGNDSLDGGAAADLLDGGAGADEASYYSALAGITVSLADPSLNTDDAVGDTYISIESLRGSAFDDTLTGDAGNNELHGEEGADTLNGGAGEDSLFGGAGADSLYGGDARDYLEGGAGADLIDGGAGTDWATYATALSSVTVDLSTGVHSGEDAVGDTLVAIEHLRGSAYDDTLIGDDGENYLSGGPGADFLDGKGGRDVVWYGFATAGISVDFGQGIGLAGEAAGDSFVNIEAVEGSDFDDLIIGGAEYSEMDGGAGDDVLSPGGGGDVIVGGTGVDTLDLSWATQGVEASLEYVLQYEYQGTLYVWQYAKVGSDTTYASLIENLTGSDFDDILVGSDEANTLEGGAGNDELRGGDGDDLHYGDAGDDYLVGSIGLDHFYGGDGVDTLDMSYTSASFTFRFDDGYLEFHNNGQREDAQEIENIIGSTGADLLYGSAADNRLEGHNGNDHIEGGGGNDYLSGGGGDDMHYGDAGDDYILGSVGLDHFYGGDGVDTLDMSYTSASITFRLDDGYLQFDGGTQVEDAQDFENVIGTTGNDTLVGSALANRLEGNGGADRIEGAAGDDDLWGGTGADRFVFGAGDGVDTIGDFEDGIDLIEFTGLTFADLSITDEAEGARIGFGASDSVLVKNVLAADLTQDDFVFA